VRPIGYVESTLDDVADAPNQSYEGAPDAWLVFNAEVREGIRDLKPGEEILVLTWLDRARRDELATYPGDDPNSPELGVFSTRSSARPNPVGLHRVLINDVDGDRIHVRALEAVAGTPIVDIKPVVDREGW
jgi:tRNA-Thr(GGU) m(6)t(6)A37 methyltransferase TsaA